MTDHRDLLRQALERDQADMDERFSVEAATYTVAVNNAHFRIEDPSDVDYLQNLLRVSLETWFLKEELYKRDVTTSTVRKVRPRWIPRWVWDLIPNEIVSQDHHFTVDRIYPNANPNLSTPTTIKERLRSGPTRTERSTWT